MRMGCDWATLRVTHHLTSSVMLRLHLRLHMHACNRIIMLMGLLVTNKLATNNRHQHWCSSRYLNMDQDEQSIIECDWSSMLFQHWDHSHSMMLLGAHLLPSKGLQVIAWRGKPPPNLPINVASCVDIGLQGVCICVDERWISLFSSIFLLLDRWSGFFNYCFKVFLGQKEVDCCFSSVRTRFC